MRSIASRFAESQIEQRRGIRLDDHEAAQALETTIIVVATEQKIGGLAAAGTRRERIESDMHFMEFEIALDNAMGPRLRRIDPRPTAPGLSPNEQVRRGKRVIAYLRGTYRVRVRVGNVPLQV